MSYVIVTNILAVIVVLGVMIIIHELGHFMAAKWFGVRVETFSIGFGRRLFGWRRGDTDYRVSLLPLGGYVKMAGENPGENLTGDAGEFLGKPKWQRFIIAFMGPAMNLALAVVLLTGLYAYKYQKLAYQERPAEIGWVDPKSSAAKAGILAGDLIVRLDDLENPKWEDVELKVLSSPNQQLNVEVKRNGEAVRTSVVPEPDSKNHIGVAGWAPYLPAIVRSVEKGFPAEKAGLHPDDQIIAINGAPLKFRPQLPQMIQEIGAKPVEFTILRDGQTFNTTMTPEKGFVPGLNRDIWRIGVDLRDETVEKRLPLGQAFVQSLETNKKFAVLIFEVVGKMFGGTMSPRSIEGPIGIARLSGEAARQGLPELINLMAAISLNLGIFNLFPIPVLDGGIILLLFIEGLMRRDLSLQVKERIIQVGFVFLILIAVFVIYNDIVKSLPDKVLP